LTIPTKIIETVLIFPQYHKKNPENVFCNGRKVELEENKITLAAGSYLISAQY